MLDPQVFLNENDELWVELLHQHIAKVIHTLGERVKELTECRCQTRQGLADLSLTDMADAMKKVTWASTGDERVSKHLRDAGVWMFWARIDGDFVPGANAGHGHHEEGQTVKPARALEETAAALKDIKPALSEVRSRLVAIYAISQRPVSDEDRERFTAEAGLTADEERLLASLIRLAASLPASKPVEKKKFFGIGKREPKAAAVAAPDDSEYSSSRTCAH